MRVKEKHLTLKEKQFIRITAKTLNPYKAAKLTYELGTRGGSKTKNQKINTISNIARNKLNKIEIQRGLQEEMEAQGIDNTLITAITKRNLTQDNNIPASNQVLDIIHKLKGSYAPEKKITMNINPDNIDKLIEERLIELKALKDK